MLSSIWAKVSGALAVIGGILLLMLRGERSARKAAELEASIEKGNRKTLEKERDIISNIDEERESWNEQASEEAIYNAQFSESLKSSNDNDAIVDGGVEFPAAHSLSVKVRS